MTQGEEIFIVVRELRRGQLARWLDFAIAYKHISRGSQGMNMTLSSFLRAQCIHGTLHRVRRGRYAFVKPLPISPMYISAGKARELYNDV